MFDHEIKLTQKLLVDLTRKKNFTHKQISLFLRSLKLYPVGKITEKAVCRSAFLTIYGTELTKTNSFIS